MKTLRIILTLLLTSGWLAAQSSSGGTGGVTVTGAVTAGHCVSFSSANVIQDTGAPCGGSGSVPGGSSGAIQFNSTATFGGTTLTDLSYSSHTLTLGSTGIFNMSAASVTAGVVLPSAAGAAPTTDAVIAFNTTNHLPVFGSNGATLTYPSSLTSASHQFLTSFTNSTGVFTQAQPAFTDVSGIATIAQGGTGSAVTVAQGGVLYFNTTLTSASSATLQVNQPMFGGGLAGAPFTGTKTGNTTQLATFFGTATAARCIDTDGAGNLQVTAADCNTGGGSLPSGTQGNPLINTSGASTYATSPLYVDVSQYSGASICAQTIAASTGATNATVYDARSITGTSTCSPNDSNNWLQSFPSDSTLLLGNITIKLGTQYRSTANVNCGAGGPFNCVAAVVIPNRIKIIGAGPDSTQIQADPANWIARSGTISAATVSGSGAQCTQASNHCYVHMTFSGLAAAGEAPNFGELVQVQSTTSGTPDSNSGMYRVCKAGNPGANGGCGNNPSSTTVDFYNANALATSNGGTVYFGVPIFAWGYDGISAAQFGAASYAQNELIQNIGISCVNIEGCVGFLNNSAEEHSIIRSVTVTRSPFAEMDFQKQGGSSFGNSGPIEDLYLLEPTSGAGSTCHYGTVLLAVGDSKGGLFDRATVTSLGCTYTGYDPGGAIIAADIMVDGLLGGNTFIGYHTEAAHDGFLVGANSGSLGVTIIGERGHSTTTNCIHLSNNFNTASGSFFAQSTVSNSCTNTIADDENSNTLTSANNNSVESYKTDGQGYPSFTDANPVDIQNGYDCYFGTCGFYNGGTLNVSTTRGGNITTLAGTVDFSASGHTLPAKVGTTAGKPATCKVGELYFANDATPGQNQFNCTATNIWTQNLNSGASGANQALSNLSAVAINSSLIPGADNGIDTGTAALRFRNQYLGGSIIWTTAGNVADTGLCRGAAGQVDVSLGGTCGATGTLFAAGFASGSAAVPGTGQISFPTSVAPSAPSAGTELCWDDSTDLTLHCINSAGSIGTLAVAKTVTSHQWFSSMAATGIFTATQPALSDLTATISSPLSLSVNTLSCPTCATTTSGGALSATSPVTISSGGLIAITGITGEQGNGALLQLSTGTVNTNRVTKFDANGNTVNSAFLEASSLLSNATNTATTYSGPIDASANAAQAQTTFRGGDETGAGGASATGGNVLIRGGNSTATNALSTAGSVLLVPGSSTGATQGLQGLLTFADVYVKAATSTQWDLACESAAMTVNNCAASPTSWLGVIEAVNTNTDVVVSPPSLIPINASSAVTLGHTVCAGGTGGQVTDSGGSATCTNGQGAHVGIVMAVAGIFPLGDGTTVTLSTTLPLIKMNTAILATTSGGGSGTVGSCGTTNAFAIYTGATTTGCGNADFTYATHTLTAGASGILDLSATSVTAGLKLPSAAGAAPINDGFIAVNTTTHALVSGSNGTTIVQAAAATGTGTSTACAAHNWVSTISALTAPTCTQPTAADLAAQPTLDVIGNLAAAKTFADGDNALVFNGASTTSGRVQFTIGETTASTSASTSQLLRLATLGTSTAVPLTIAQGAGVNATNAPLTISVLGGTGGANAGATSPGLKGGGSTFTGGNGSNAGATSGTGGAGGDINLAGGTGGTAAVASTTGAGGNVILTPGAAGGTGTAGAPGNVQIVGPSVLAANTTSFLNITGTWNTSGVVDAGIFENITNTGSGAASKLIDLQVGGTSEFSIDKTGMGIFGAGTAPTVGTAGGAVAIEGTAFTGTSTNYGWYNDSTAHCFDIINQTTNIGCAAGLAAAESFTAAQTFTGGIINTTTPIRDQTRFVLVSSMTAVATAGVNIGSTGASNATFSWPVTAANWYDLQCKLPVTFAATATIKFQLVSISGAVTISNVNSETMGNTGAAAVFQDLATIAGTTLATSVTPVTGAPGASEMVTYSSQFLTSHAGNIGLEFIANGTNNVQMLQGGECGITQIN